MQCGSVSVQTFGRRQKFYSIWAQNTIVSSSGLINVPSLALTIGGLLDGMQGRIRAVLHACRQGDRNRSIVPYRCCTCTYAYVRYTFG